MTRDASEKSNDEEIFGWWQGKDQRERGNGSSWEGKPEIGCLGGGKMKKWVVAMEIRKTTATPKKNETIYRSLMDWALKKMDQGFKKNMLG